MRSRARTLLLATVALVAAVAIFIALTLPPRALRLDGSVPSEIVTGAYHIHTDRSDGTGTPDDIAAAAARAGLQFVILTDHGNAMRAPDAPVYRHGVLCIDAVEVSTFGGHIVGLGLPDASPYPLAGESRDVIEDIRRMGGKAVIAHPDSPDPDLRWRAGNTPYDGIEWINADSEWRDESAVRLLGVAARSFMRPAESIASLFGRPRTLDRWDAAARTRPIFGLAAVDSHARIGLREKEEPRQRTALRWPSHEAMFRTLAQSVVLDAPLSGDARTDADRLIAAVVAGRSFSIVRAFGGPAHLAFEAQQGSAVTPMGGLLTDFQAETTFRAHVPQAPGAALRLLHNGRQVAAGMGMIAFATRPAPGTYRVEATLPGHAAPWIVSNPILVVAPAPQAPVPPSETPAPSALVLPLEPGRWGLENDPTSTGAITAESEALRFDFQMGAGPSAGQFVAVSTPIDDPSGIASIVLEMRASMSMRVSVQVRLPSGRVGRWRRSVHIDQPSRRVTIPLSELDPVDVVTSQRPIVTPIKSLLLVVDTLNSATGSKGTLWVSDASLVVGQTGG